VGRMTAIDLATEDYLGVEAQIGIHLTSNHYPPVPKEMVSVCIAAIDSVNDYGDWGKDIELPKGTSWKGLTTAPAYAIIEAHHLDPWIIESELD